MSLIKKLGSGVFGIAKPFFGGGSTLAYVIFAGLLLGVFVKYTSAIARADRFEAENVELKAANDGKDLTIRTQAQTQARKSKQVEQSNDAETHVNNADDPVDAALDWLRDNPDKAATDPD